MADERPVFIVNGQKVYPDGTPAKEAKPAAEQPDAPEPEHKPARRAAAKE